MGEVRNTIIGNPEKLSQGGALAWVCGRADGLVAWDKCPFLTAVVVMKGLASQERRGGSNEKRIFHGSENSSTAVAQLELLPTAPRLSGIFVSLGNTETCSTLSLPLPLAPVTLTHPFAPRVHLVRSLPSIWLLRQLLSCVPKPFLPLWVKLGSLWVPRPQTGAGAHKKKLR